MQIALDWQNSCLVPWIFLESMKFSIIYSTSDWAIRWLLVLDGSVSHRHQVIVIKAIWHFVPDSLQLKKADDPYATHFSSSLCMFTASCHSVSPSMWTVLLSMFQSWRTLEQILYFFALLSCFLQASEIKDLVFTHRFNYYLVKTPLLMFNLLASGAQTYGNSWI